MSGQPLNREHAQEHLDFLYGAYQRPVKFFLSVGQWNPQTRRYGRSWRDLPFQYPGDVNGALDYADRYSRLGWAVFLTCRTFDAAASRREKKYAEPSGLVAWCELDTKNGDREDVNRIVKQAQAEGAYVVWSGSGGAHVYYHLDKALSSGDLEKVNIALRERWNLPGVDSVHDMARVLRLAGSHHDKTGVFVPVIPVQGNTPHPVDSALLLPQVMKLRMFEDSSNSADFYRWVADECFRKGLTVDEAVQLAIASGAPGIGHFEGNESLIRADVERIYAKLKDKPGYARTVTLADAKATETWEEEFWTARPELAHVRTFAQSRLASPWAVLGAVLARVVASCEPSLVLPPIVGTVCSLNLYVGLVGQSSDGKGIAYGVAKDAFTWSKEVTEVKPGSGEGLAHAYMYRPKATKEDKFPEAVQHTTAVLFTVPEIDTFDAVTRRTGATLMPELRSAYMGEQLGFQYADASKRLPVPEHKYRLCLIAGIQPTRAGVLLNDADGGTPQRFIWLPAIDRDAPDVEPAEPMPMSWKCPYELSDVQDNGGVRLLHVLRRLDVCEEARRTTVEIRRNRNRGHGDPLDGHANLTRLKLAAALGLLNGHQGVTDEDWRLAELVMAKSNETRNHVIAKMGEKAHTENEIRGRADGHREAAKTAVIDREMIRKVAEKVLKKLTNDWKPRNELRGKLNSTDRKYFEDVIEHLLIAGQVESRDVVYQGQPGHEYRLKQAS